LSDLISALIGRAVTVETVIANEPPADDTRQRHLRFDVACKTSKGEPVNVEMAFNPDANEQVRLEYHAARLFVGQGIHGKDKTYDDLKVPPRVRTTKVVLPLMFTVAFIVRGNVSHLFG